MPYSNHTPFCQTNNARRACKRVSCSLPLPPISCPVRRTPPRASRALRPFTAAFNAHTVRRRHRDPQAAVSATVAQDLSHFRYPESRSTLRRLYHCRRQWLETGRGTSLEAFVISQSVPFCYFCCCCPASALFVYSSCKN